MKGDVKNSMIDLYIRNFSNILLKVGFFVALDVVRSCFDCVINDVSSFKELEAIFEDRATFVTS